MERHDLHRRHDLRQRAQERIRQSVDVPAYAQINVGLSHAFKWSPDRKPLTVRFNIVNLFDTVYQIRDGTGIGVFAPQYGPRRGFFVSLAQAL